MGFFDLIKKKKANHNVAKNNIESRTHDDYNVAKDNIETYVHNDNKDLKDFKKFLGENNIKNKPVKVNICFADEENIIQTMTEYCELYPNIYFNIIYAESDKTARADSAGYGIDRGPDTYTDQKKLKEFAKNSYNMEKKYKCKILFNEQFTLEQAIIATDKIKNWVDEINSAKVDNRNLTTLEKFLYAFSIVNNFIYHGYEKDTGHSLEGRDIISVLTSDYIVCVGFSKLLTELCKQLEIDCSSKIVGSHELCLVDMKDEVYDIDGLFVSDPTDPYSSKLNNSVNIGSALIPFDVAKIMYKELQNNKCYTYTRDGNSKALNKSYDEIKKICLDKLIHVIDDEYIEKSLELKDLKYIEGYCCNCIEKIMNNKEIHLKDLSFGYDTIKHNQVSNGITKEEFKNIVTKNINTTQKLESISKFEKERREYFDNRKENTSLPKLESIFKAFENVLKSKNVKDDDIKPIFLESCDRFRPLAGLARGKDYPYDYRSSKKSKAEEYVDRNF